MEQTAYLEVLLHSIKNHIELPVQEVINNDFKRLKSFHKEMLFTHCYEYQNVYYENIFSQHVHFPDFEKLISLLMNKTNPSLSFLEHVFNKYPTLLITNKQENIINFPVDSFPLLFSKTPLTPSKTTLCLFKLFKSPEENNDKITFIMENQKKGFLPYNPDMYYLMLFFSYMKKNSLAKRKRFSEETKSFYYKPAKITQEFIFISKLIFDNFDNIFDLIKPNMVKNTYKGQSFENTIINEEDFTFFIDFVAAFLQKEKIAQKIPQKSITSTKPKKI